ncbi:MAG: NAD(P)/FAD-dependent oxidoreductase, partial [Anaerolineales bacterium]
MTSVYDTIVVGAGPGGSAAALHLARQGLQVLLLDRHAFPRDKTCGDGLSPEAQRILDRLGLAELAPQRGFRIDSMSVTSPSGARFEAALDPDGQPGYVVPRIALDDGIRSGAIAAGAEFIGQVRVTGIDEREGTVSAAGSASNHSWQTRSVILAVGANMGLLKSLGLLPARPSLGYAARVYVDGLPKQPHQLQFRFDGIPLPGYGWIFPTSSSSANIGMGVFKAARDSIYELLDHFLAHPAITDLIGSGRSRRPTKAYPLRLDFHRSPLRRGRLLLVGEAAGLVNPFSGEGIDYALESGVLAGECLEHCFNAGDWSERALSNYERRLRR